MYFMRHWTLVVSFREIDGLSFGEIHNNVDGELADMTRSSIRRVRIQRHLCSMDSESRRNFATPIWKAVRRTHSRSHSPNTNACEAEIVIDDGDLRSILGKHLEKAGVACLEIR